MMLHPTHRRVFLLLLLLAGVCFPALFPAPRALAFRSGQPANLVLGQRTFTTSTYATANRLSNPQGIAVDPASGAVFVADTESHRVLRFGALASLSNGAAAEGVLGQPDLLDSTMGTTARGLNRPSDVAVDRDGRLWVVDAGNHRVLRFDAAASKPDGAPADGVLGQPDFTSGTEATTAQSLSRPGGIAVDDSGRLWVADSGNQRVLRYDAAAGKPNGAPADGVLGHPDFTSRIGTDMARRMSNPQSLAVDGSGRLWIADTMHNRVLRFDAAASKPNGAPADGVLGKLDLTSTDSPARGAIYMPKGVVADRDGRLWVSTMMHLLRFDDAAGKPNGAVADNRLGGASGYYPSASSMYLPESLAVDGDGRLWVADTLNNRALRFDGAAFQPTAAPADGVLGYGDFIRQRSVSEFSGFFHDVAVDLSTGKVFVADMLNNRVLRFATHTALSTGVSAEAVLGQPDFADYIQRTTREGMYRPAALTVDQDGRLWVAEEGNSRVLRFDAAASKLNGAPADGVLGQPNFTSLTRATTSGGMRSPQGVTVDADGRLWVADSWSNRVLRFDDAASKPNGAPADGVLGQPDFTSLTQATISEGMRYPLGVTADADGRLWIADAGNRRVLRFDDAASKPNGASADGVLGQPDFASATAATTAQGMAEAVDVVTDNLGRLWVTDKDNSRVLRFDDAASKPNGAPADGVLGQPDFTSSTAGITARRVFRPRGLALDADGNLWVADDLNNISDARVLRFEDVAPAQAVVRAVHATSQEPLPNTLVQASGLSSFGCRTDTSGACPLADLPPGTYTLALTKTDNVAGISAYDASLILQLAAGPPLSGAAFTAGDTSGDGKVSSFDAALVLQYVAHMRSLPFPAGRVWTFTAPQIRALDQDQQITVDGVLIGDVSGHLAAEPLGLHDAGVPAAGALRLVRRGVPEASGYQTVELWLTPGAAPLWSLAATMRIDPAPAGDIQLVSNPPSGVLLAAQATPDGQVHLALASAGPLPPGAVISMRYRAGGTGGVTVAWAETNEGGVPAVLPSVVQDWQLYLPLARRDPSR